MVQIIGNSVDWVKFLSMKKQYYNNIFIYRILIIITDKHFFKKVKHEKLINVIIN
jgi:hypothetical protein